MIQTLFGSVEQEPTLLERLKSGVQKTRAGLVTRLEDMLQGAKQIDADLLDELEFTLISSDIGVRTTTEILSRNCAVVRCCSSPWERRIAGARHACASPTSRSASPTTPPTGRAS